MKCLVTLVCFWASNNDDELFSSVSNGPGKEHLKEEFDGYLTQPPQVCEYKLLYWLIGENPVARLHGMCCLYLQYLIFDS